MLAELKSNAQLSAPAARAWAIREAYEKKYGRNLPKVPRETPPYPFRKVGTNYVNLTQLFEWYKLPLDDRQPLWGNPARKPNPLPNWKYFEKTVVQNLPDGLVLKEQDGSLFLLRNFPNRSKIVDNAIIRFVAFPSGVEQKADIRGGARTIPSWDHGIPYNPKAIGEDGKALLLSNEPQQ